jgi:hypothetical protein
VIIDQLYFIYTTNFRLFATLRAKAKDATTQKPQKSKTNPKRVIEKEPENELIDDSEDNDSNENIEEEPTPAPEPKHIVS